MADPGYLKKINMVVSWATLAALLVVIILILRKSPPPNVPYDAHAAARVERKLTAAGEASDSSQPAQVQIDRTELNSYLKQNLDLAGSDAGGSPSSANTPSLASTVSADVPTAAPGGLPSGNGAADPLAALSSGDQATLDQVQSSVKDVNVDMDGDIVKAYVVFNFHGKDLSLELDGHLGAQNGYIKFDPVSGKLGSLPLPQSTLNSAVEKMMSSPENREKLRLPDNISDIQIVNGQAVVSYK